MDLRTAVGYQSHSSAAVSLLNHRVPEISTASQLLPLHREPLLFLGGMCGGRHYK